MDYEVILSRQAERELNEAADWIAAQSASSAIAEKWFNGFVDTLMSLERMPQRCGLARENRRFPCELRQILYGRKRTYRALFTIRENRVVILCIRHSAQANVGPDDIEH